MSIHKMNIQKMDIQKKIIRKMIIKKRMTALKMKMIQKTENQNESSVKSMPRATSWMTLSMNMKRPLSMI